MNEKQIWKIIRQRDLSISDSDVDKATKTFLDDVDREKYDFNNYKRDIFTQQGKKRAVYSYPRLSSEDILCQYLKRQLDNSFQIRYASRSKIMNILFNILPAVKDMNDFIIIRADFKSFFDSVLVEHVYLKYIQESLMSREDKDILEQYVAVFDCCYAGLCLSNGMTEIICRDFDERIKVKLANVGVFFYERYVDDLLIITNRYISKDDFWELMNNTIREVFGKCQVKLNISPGKFSYISRRNLYTIASFNFLGYEFQMEKGNKKEIQFKYGIVEKKRRKYRGIIENAFVQYKKNNNVELLRQRIKIYSSRVVIARTIGSSSFDWLTKGIVSNYNELRYHMDRLLPDTEFFMKNLYFELFNQYGCKIPYFLKKSGTDPSIYSIHSNMSRNRTIMFEKNIGVSEKTIIKWINKIDPTYNAFGKDYYRIVVDYLDLIKVE